MRAHWIVPAVAALLLATFEAPATAQQETSADEVTVQRVWSGTEVSFGMTRPSPDGRYLTQGWFEWDLGIIDLVTRKRGTLGLKSGNLSEDPSWSHRAFFSPDGEQIAYVWRTWRPVGRGRTTDYRAVRRILVDAASGLVPRRQAPARRVVGRREPLFLSAARVGRSHRADHRT